MQLSTAQFFLLDSGQHSTIENTDSKNRALLQKQSNPTVSNSTSVTINVLVDRCFFNSIVSFRHFVVVLYSVAFNFQVCLIVFVNLYILMR